MTDINKEIAIIKLQDRKQWLGMANIGHLPYEDQVKARAEYAIQVADIDRQIRKLRDNND